MCAVTGCRASDALKEIIYDQESEIIDYDNPNKYKLNDDTAEQEDDSISASETSDTSVNTEVKQNLVVYSSDPNSPQYTAKQSRWSASPEFNGLEASSTVNFVESDDPTAPVEDLGSKDEEDKEEDQDQPQASSNGGSDEDDSKQGTKASSKSKNVTSDESEDGGNDTKSDKKDKEEVAEEEGINGNVSSDLTGDYTDTPELNRVAAYGDLAVLVQIIGGEGALTAADKELLASDFSSVFQDEGASSIKKGWSGDGSASGTIDVDAVIKSGADAVLVTSGSYMTSAEKKALEAANVQVLKVYPMTNSKYIRKNAETIGDMLEKSDALSQGWDSVGMASKFTKFYKDLLEDCVNANGGKLASRNKETYEAKNTTSYTYNSDAKYTLLLDGYDSSAKYTASIDGWTPKTDGAILATIGYSKSPVSYYIQCGGLINNGAATVTSETGQIIAWQFNSNVASFAKAKWSFSSGGLVDKSINATPNRAGGWNWCLFTADTSAANNGEVAVISSSFGTESFPNCIAATQQIKSKLISNSGNKQGIYHPYDFVSANKGATTINFFGYETSGGTSVFSSIGVDSTISNTNAFSGGKISDDSVKVNPHGLFSSWITGSPESVLETAWVNDVVNGSVTKVDWEDQVKDFYSTFYRYDLSSSEMSEIEDGLAK